MVIIGLYRVQIGLYRGIIRLYGVITVLSLG